MIKSTILALLIFSWLFAIFAPSLITLANNGEGIFISVNLNEEEQQEHGKKNDSEEKKLLEYWIAQIQISPQGRTFLSDQLGIIISSHAIEIPLPPPEFFIKQV